MNFMRGVGCITPGALEIEGKKKASELISEVTKEGFDFSTTNKSLPDVFLLNWVGKLTYWINARLPPLCLINPFMCPLQISEPDEVQGFVHFAKCLHNPFSPALQPHVVGILKWFILC